MVNIETTEIDCPRARSSMTPCIARDGSLALADDGVCVGCGAQPKVLVADLAQRFEGARVAGTCGGTPTELADALPHLVVGYIASKAGA